MRTTIRLDDQLLTAAKRRAVETGTTLTAVIEGALRRELAAVRTPSKPAPLPTVKGALRPGIDLDDTAGLLEVMDQP